MPQHETEPDPGPSFWPVVKLHKLVMILQDLALCGADRIIKTPAFRLAHPRGRTGIFEPTRAKRIHVEIVVQVAEKTAPPA